MKQIQTIVEVNDGLEALLGETVMLFCVRYNYVGKLTGVNSTCVKLTNAQMVFDTGAFVPGKYDTAEVPYNSEFYVQTAAIEMFVKMPS